MLAGQAWAGGVQLAAAGCWLQALAAANGKPGAVLPSPPYSQSNLRDNCEEGEEGNCKVVVS